MMREGVARRREGRGAAVAGVVGRRSNCMEVCMLTYQPTCAASVRNHKESFSDHLPHHSKEMSAAPPPM
jgi:hypothetical protein